MAAPPPVGPARASRAGASAGRRRARALVVALLLASPASSAVAFVRALRARREHAAARAGARRGAARARVGAAARRGARVVPRETAVEPRPRLAEPAAGAPRRASELRAGTRGHLAPTPADRRGRRRRRRLARCRDRSARLARPERRPDHRYDTPWRRGTALVDEEGSADRRRRDHRRARSSPPFPQGADPRELGSPVVVVRVDPARCGCRAGAPAGRPRGSSPTRRSAPTPAARSSLYRSPLNEPTSTSPGARLPVPLLDVRRARAAPRSSSARPGARCPSCRSAIGAGPRAASRPAASRARSARLGGRAP